MMRIGFVGLGAMGMPMALNLVRRGMQVHGFDARAAARDAFAAEGGIPAMSAVEAARSAELFVLMVVNIGQARAVLLDEGALPALPADAIVVLMATCPPRGVAELARAVTATGRLFVDAPVSGGVVGARAGSLTIMAAGPPETVAKARPALEALGSKIVQVGTEPGQGATVKVVNQLLCGIHLAAAGEALALARKVGLDPAIVLDVVGGSSAASWMLRDRGPRMVEPGPEITSTVDIFVKDLGLVVEAGHDAGQPLPLATAAHALFAAASRQGFGSLDDSQVIRVMVDGPA